jgi:hypothetical protein
MPGQKIYVRSSHLQWQQHYLQVVQEIPIHRIQHRQLQQKAALRQIKP